MNGKAAAKTAGYTQHQESVESLRQPVLNIRGLTATYAQIAVFLSKQAVTEYKKNGEQTQAPVKLICDSINRFLVILEKERCFQIIETGIAGKLPSKLNQSLSFTMSAHLEPHTNLVYHLLKPTDNEFFKSIPKGSLSDEMSLIKQRTYSSRWNLLWNIIKKECSHTIEYEEYESKFSSALINKQIFNAFLTMMVIAVVIESNEFVHLLKDSKENSNATVETLYEKYKLQDTPNFPEEVQNYLTELFEQVKTDIITN